MRRQLQALIRTERSGHFQTRARYCRAGSATRAISCVNPGLSRALWRRPAYTLFRNLLSLRAGTREYLHPCPSARTGRAWMPLTKTGRNPGPTALDQSMAGGDVAGSCFCPGSTVTMGSPHDGMSERAAVQAHSTGSLEWFVRMPRGS
jgi:hypothetical protein